jgi:capsular exopolysaccharide synthesis family protein
MPDNDTTTTLREYLGTLRDRRWLILSVTLIAIAVGLAYSLIKSPTYEASATLQFQDPANQLQTVTQAQANFDPLPAATAAANSKEVTSEAVLNRVQKAIPNLGLTNNELNDKINAVVQPDSNLIEIKATSGSKTEAARLANTVAEQARAEIQGKKRAQYQQQADELAQLGASKDPFTSQPALNGVGRLRTLAQVAQPVTITRPATIPSSPASPKPIRDTILAGILGLMLGVGAAFLRNALDRRLKDSHVVQRELGMPLVGYVRSDALGLTGGQQNGKKGELGENFVSEDDLEAFRILRTNVGFLAGDNEIKSIVVTSALPEEGKSTVAAWYAYVNATAGKRTLLVECDFRRPVLASRFGVDGTPGLSEYLGDGLKPKDVLRTVDVRGRQAVDVLPLIPAGENVFQPAEMIASQKFKDFVKEVSGVYDLVVFDSAPLLPVGDTLELIPDVDAVLFCVRLDQTTREQAQAAKQALDHLPEKPTGLVITGVSRGAVDDYYGYYSSYSSARTKSRA